MAEQLAARIDDRFRLLTGGSRAALPRHRTLRAVVDWLWTARATVEGGDVRVDAADLPREVRRRLVRRAVTVARAAAGLTEPAFNDAGNVEALLDGLEQGRRVTHAGVLASVRDGRWRLRPAPPRKG